jgi:hypothetical protein
MKNKKILGVVMSISMFMMACLALADESKQNDFKIIIVNAEKSIPPRIIHSNELTTGIYVVTYKSLRSLNNAETDSPAINNIIRGLIAKRGFKLADQLAGSNMAVMFTFIGDIDLSAVEDQATLPVNTADAIVERSIIDATIPSSAINLSLQGAINGNKAAGVAGAVGILGSFVSSDKDIRFNGLIQTNPKIDKGLFGGDVINKSERAINQFRIYYRKARGVRDITPEMEALLVIGVNKWIDTFMVLDVDPVAASGVATTSNPLEAASSVSVMPVSAAPFAPAVLMTKLRSDTTSNMPAASTIEEPKK